LRWKNLSFFFIIIKMEYIELVVFSRLSKNKRIEFDFLLAV